MYGQIPRCTLTSTSLWAPTEALPVRRSILVVYPSPDHYPSLLPSLCDNEAGGAVAPMRGPASLLLLTCTALLTEGRIRVGLRGPVAAVDAVVVALVVVLLLLLLLLLHASCFASPWFVFSCDFVKSLSSTSKRVLLLWSLWLLRNADIPITLICPWGKPRNHYLNKPPEKVRTRAGALSTHCVTSDRCPAALLLPQISLSCCTDRTAHRGHNYGPWVLCRARWLID